MLDLFAGRNSKVCGGTQHRQDSGVHRGGSAHPVLGGNGPVGGPHRSSTECEAVKGIEDESNGL